jgi:hypothetical protein
MKNWMDLYHQEDIICSQIGECKIIHENGHRIIVMGENKTYEIHFVSLLYINLTFGCKLTFCINFMLQTGT